MEEESDLRVSPWIVVAAAVVIVAAGMTAAFRWDASDSGPVAGTAGGDGTLEDSDVDGLLEPWLPAPHRGGEAAEEEASSADADTSTLRMWARPDLPAGFEDDVAGLPGVTAVMTTRRTLVSLVASWDADGAPLDELRPGYVVPMQAAALDLNHPDVHADLGSLNPGQVALSATAARLRGLAAGGVLDLEGHRFPVGAVVPDEVAGSSEVLLSSEDAERFDFARRSVTVRHVGDDDALREAIAGLLEGVHARIRSPRDEAAGPLVRSQVEMKQRFGEFTHGPLRSDGSFAQDPAWVEANITTARVPILGAVTCHRDFVPLVAGALGELEEAGLAHLVEPSDYGGCWSPRRIGSGRTNSKHAWGAAIDINASANAYGEAPRLDRRVVETFRRWGMRWGGDFLVPDGMHFEWYEDPAVGR